MFLTFYNVLSYMDRTNLEMYPYKNVLGILINEGATNPPLKEKKTPSKRGKGNLRFQSTTMVARESFLTPTSHFLSWTTTNLCSPKGTKFVLGLAQTRLEFQRPPLLQLIRCQLWPQLWFLSHQYRVLLPDYLIDLNSRG